MNKELLNLLIQVTNNTPQYLFDESNEKLKKGMLQSEGILEGGKLISARADTRNKHFPEHNHDYVEIVYMCQGKSTHILNGEKVILKEGEFLFLNQSCIQEIYPSEKNDIAINFIVHPRFFENALKTLGTEETALHRFIVQYLQDTDRKPNYLHFCVADVLPVQNLAENLVWNLLYGLSDQNRLNEATMSLLLLQLLNHIPEPEYSSEDSSIIIPVLNYIDSNYVNGSLIELADSMFYDFCLLSKHIKRITGKTYTELVQEKRLSQACLLLKTTNLNVSEVSEKVGYENVSFFHRLFSKTYGITPKMFRKSSK